VVITSVDRDDLPDGGAAIFADTIRETRARRPECRIEVLTPDFQGKESSLHTVLDARPDVMNHNVETVPRLYRMARSGGRYSRTIELLDRCPAVSQRRKMKLRRRPRPTADVVEKCTIRTSLGIRGGRDWDRLHLNHRPGLRVGLTFILRSLKRFVYPAHRSNSFRKVRFE
jgi:hypothetical protein